MYVSFLWTNSIKHELTLLISVVTTFRQSYEFKAAFRGRDFWLFINFSFVPRIDWDVRCTGYKWSHEHVQNPRYPDPILQVSAISQINSHRRSCLVFPTCPFSHPSPSPLLPFARRWHEPVYISKVSRRFPLTPSVAPACFTSFPLILLLPLAARCVTGLWERRPSPLVFLSWK